MSNEDKTALEGTQGATTTITRPPGDLLMLQGSHDAENGVYAPPYAANTETTEQIEDNHAYHIGYHHRHRQLEGITELAK